MNNYGSAGSDLILQQWVKSDEQSQMEYQELLNEQAGITNHSSSAAIGANVVGQTGNIIPVNLARVPLESPDNTAGATQYAITAIDLQPQLQITLAATNYMPIPVMATPNASGDLDLSYVDTWTTPGTGINKSLGTLMFSDRIEDDGSGLPFSQTGSASSCQHTDTFESVFQGVPGFYGDIRISFTATDPQTTPQGKTYSFNINVVPGASTLDDNAILSDSTPLNVVVRLQQRLVTWNLSTIWAPPSM